MDEPIDFEDDDFGEDDFNQDVYNDEYWWTLLPQHLELEDQLRVMNNNKKMAKWTLRELCLKAVIANKGLLVKSKSESMKLKNLTEGLKSDLLKMLALFKNSKEYFFIYDSLLVKEMRCFVTMLLHHNIKYLHMPSCDDWNEENKLEFEKLLEVIGYQCSGLQTFRFIDNWGSINDNPALTKQSWYGRAFFRALPGLSSLRVLELDSYNCNDWALQQIGMHGQNIVDLQVCLVSKVTRVGFEALSKLSHLRKFLFGENMVDKNLEQKCLLLCSQFLPQLRIVGRDYEELFFCCMDLVDGSYYDQVVQQSTPTTLSLEGLVLSWDDQPKQNVHLPNLEALHLFYPKGDVVGLCDRFSTLTSLGFYDEADGSVVMKVLQKMGQRLLRLVLEKVCQNLWLVEVLRLCPRLKMFRFQFCHFKDSSQFPEGLLSCLEEFVCDNYSDPPHGFVAELLCAPLVKKLSFYDCFLTMQEVEKLIALVQQRSILQQAVRLTWRNFEKDWPSDSWMSDIAHFKLLLITINVNLPNLRIIEGPNDEPDED